MNQVSLARRSVFLLALLSLLTALPLHAELPKDVLKDQYMYSLMEALKAKDYETALPYFKQLEDLHVPLSDSFYYFKWSQASGGAWNNKPTRRRCS